MIYVIIYSYHKLFLHIRLHECDLQMSIYESCDQFLHYLLVYLLPGCDELSQSRYESRRSWATTCTIGTVKLGYKHILYKHIRAISISFPEPIEFTYN
jgi:hypothetical protein